jgi:CheY-like chemotaxis protein
MNTPVWKRMPVVAKSPDAENAASAAGDVREPGHPEAWTRSILLVEDNAYLAAMAEMLLETLGYKIKYAPTARQALEMLSDGTAVDAVFTDILMPGGMSGIEFAKIVRERLPDLPIVLTTGSPLAADDARALGFAVLERPCPVDVLESTLRTALAQTPAAETGTSDVPDRSPIVQFDRRRAVA